MTFNDTQVGDIVNITVSNNDKELTMESSILAIVDNCLVVNPFTVNGVMLDFPKNLDIKMLVLHPDTTPYFWQKISIDKKVYHEKDVHVITSKFPGVKMNRRNNFRVYIGANVLLSGVNEGKPIKATLKDISNSGFAVLVPTDLELGLHQKISFEYSDTAFKKYFELSGRPIRKAESDSYNLYGCILDKRYPDLENYLAQKQMENRPNRKKQDDNDKNNSKNNSDKNKDSSEDPRGKRTYF